MMRLGEVTYLVRDYDEAITWFTDRLGFVLATDADLGAGKRWVRVVPAGGGTALLLAKAVGKQVASIGRQAGGRVFLFVHSDDFEHDHARLRATGINFVEEPRHEAYGIVAVFEDLYGNRWDLIQLKR
jgi:catechol 2,3-dioxygenase-like lactoylglutathione lyase family enzyme